MKLRLLTFALVVSGAVYAAPPFVSGPTIQLADEGTYKGNIYKLDCSGTGVTCTYDGGVGYVSATTGAVGKVAEAYAADASITAQTATALAADPADCSAGQYASGINASGTLSCGTPPGTYVAPDAGVWRTYLVAPGTTITQNDFGGAATTIFSFDTAATKSYTVDCLKFTSQDAGTSFGARHTITGPTAQRVTRALVYCSAAGTQAYISQNGWAWGAGNPATSAGDIVCPDKVYLFIVDAGVGTVTIGIESEQDGNAHTVWPGSYCDVTVLP